MRQHTAVRIVEQAAATGQRAEEWLSQDGSGEWYVTFWDPFEICSEGEDAELRLNLAREPQS
jgi:hypothetical protein